MWFIENWEFRKFLSKIGLLPKFVKARVGFLSSYQEGTYICGRQKLPCWSEPRRNKKYAE